MSEMKIPRTPKGFGWLLIMVFLIGSYLFLTSTNFFLTGLGFILFGLVLFGFIFWWYSPEASKNGSI